MSGNHEECLTSASKGSSKTGKKVMKLQVPIKYNGPVVVYMKSPKIIEVRSEDFKGVVQQLTGNHAR